MEWSERGTHCLRMCSCFWVRADSRAWGTGKGADGRVQYLTVEIRERVGAHCEFAFPALEVLEAGLDVLAWCGRGDVVERVGRGGL